MCGEYKITDDPGVHHRKDSSLEIVCCVFGNIVCLFVIFPI